MPWASLWRPSMRMAPHGCKACGRSTHGREVREVGGREPGAGLAGREQVAAEVPALDERVGGHDQVETVAGPLTSMSTDTAVRVSPLFVAFTSSFVPAYPTRAEILKRAAGQFYTESLFSPRTKLLVRLLAQLP